MVYQPQRSFVGRAPGNVVPNQVGKQGGGTGEEPGETAGVPTGNIDTVLGVILEMNQGAWPAHLGEAPVPKVVISPRHPKGPRELDVPVDPVALAAGDHNGSTLYQHQRFNAVVRGQGQVEVALRDGLAAVMIGLAAQESARTGQAISMVDGDYDLSLALS